MVSRRRVTLVWRRLCLVACTGLDVLMFGALLPVYLCVPFFLVVGRRAAKRAGVLFAGLEHVIDKTATRGRFFQDRGFRVCYYSFELTGHRSALVDPRQVITAGRLMSVDLLRFLFLCLKDRPLYVEMYYQGMGARQVFYTAVARRMGTFVLSILRGELYHYDQQNPLKRFLRAWAWRLSDAIFYREIYMREHFDRLRLDRQKTHFDPNKVPIGREPTYEKKHKEILFLNSVKRWRRIELLVESIPLVLKENPAAKLLLVGARNRNEYDYVNGLVRKQGVEDNTEVHYWTDNPNHFYERASVFVLPADLVFCNFSLLESMERGLPAIVADVDDAEKIVTHGVNGFLVKQNPVDLAEHISRILRDEPLRVRMGQAARKKIIEEFDDKDRMMPILDLLRKRYPGMGVCPRRGGSNGTCVGAEPLGL